MDPWIPKDESEKLKEAEMEVDGKVRQEESAEIQSPKRKVFRVESEETQDYVCETPAISQEEADEVGFVPSALCEYSQLHMSVKHDHEHERTEHMMPQLQQPH